MKKIVLILLALLVILSSCTQAKDSADISNDIIESTDQTSSENAENPDDSSNEIVENPAPLSIETPEGIVIVGIIQKDEKGWYFEPECPLDIKLTYYEDRPEIFDYVTRIEMLPIDGDGVDKTIYQNQTVTISGALSNPRGAGILYLIPYKVQIGKQVEKSYGDASITPPQIEEKGYVAELLDPKMQLKLDNGQYVFNPYVLSEETLQWYGNDFADFYVTFVDAFLNYETTVPCPSREFADTLSILLFYEFPLFNIDGDMNFQCYDNQNHSISWKYTSKNQKEHDRCIQEFLEEADGFLSGVKQADDDVTKARTIYENFTSEMTYDYDAQYTRQDIEPYYAYTKKSGICYTFALAYAQLLTQAGIESKNVTGTDKNGEVHLWNIIKLNEKYYFADPTYEVNTKTNRYFAIGLKERLAEFDEENIFFGNYQRKNISEIQMETDSLAAENARQDRIQN